MTAEKQPRRDPTPEEIMDSLSPPARRCIRSLAGTPDAAADWYNRLTDVRAAMKVGVEVMEQSAREEAQAVGHPTPGGNFKMQAASYALGATTAIECCMWIIEKLHPSLLKANVTKESKPPTHLNGDGSRIRNLDVD